MALEVPAQHEYEPSSWAAPGSSEHGPWAYTVAEAAAEVAAEEAVDREQRTIPEEEEPSMV